MIRMTDPQDIKTTRALEIVLSRVKLDPQTASVLKGQLAHERRKESLQAPAEEVLS